MKKSTGATYILNLYLYSVPRNDWDVFSYKYDQFKKKKKKEAQITDLSLFFYYFYFGGRI